MASPSSSPTHSSPQLKATQGPETETEAERGASTLTNSLSITSGLTSVRRGNKFSKNSHLVPALGLTASATRNDNGIEAMRYEETSTGKPPIAVIRTPPRVPPTETHPALRRPHSGLSSEQDWKRDSGLATTTSSKPREDSLAGSTLEDREKETWLKIDFDANSSVPNTAISFNMAEDRGLQKSDTKASNSSRWRRPLSRKSSNTLKSPTEEYTPISIPIPTESLMDEETLNSIEFSKRGSMMLLGSKALSNHTRENATRRQPSFSMLSAPSTSTKMLTEDVEKESQKVRSMYESGSKFSWEEGQFSSLAQQLSDLTTAEPEKSNLDLPLPNIPYDRPGSTLSIRNEHELAGGIEDWEDVEGEDVDRYGFINPGRRKSLPGTPEPKITRVSTMLQLASEAPRKKRAWGRATSSAASNRSSQQKAPSRKISARSLISNTSTSSQKSSSGRLRSVSNRFPGNKDRRMVEEAGDMLTLPPGLAAIAEDEEGGKAASALKMKEIERGEKWRKMAKVVKIGADGQGMEFQFNPRNAKVIERTWKGIPDRWRSAAWYSFLAASAAKRKDTVPDDKLVAAFHESHSRSSADDTQIDLDVPRTINSHIMFRRRYRGGQRLLFRVLHAFSLYFPKPGYVQGMAALAATLLCYFDEEKTFIMLVRMWTLRGLDKLYEIGFKGLLAAINEFQEEWMVGRDVAKKLTDLNIEPTSWGIRWYLTLFNYSIPFAAQLRVWDIFMLLGDIDPLQKATDERPFQHGLDILHATSAALMDATRDIVMDDESDFENVMKVLTSWIPVKDEEMLMKVVRAEWKIKRGRRGLRPAPRNPA